MKKAPVRDAELSPSSSRRSGYMYIGRDSGRLCIGISEFLRRIWRRLRRGIFFAAITPFIYLVGPLFFPFGCWFLLPLLLRGTCSFLQGKVLKNTPRGFVRIAIHYLSVNYFDLYFCKLSRQDDTPKDNRPPGFLFVFFFGNLFFVK